MESPVAHDPLNEPLVARVIEGEVVITGPNGFNGSLTIDAARTSAENLLRAIEGASEPGEVYQKPLG